MQGLTYFLCSMWVYGVNRRYNTIRYHTITYCMLIFNVCSKTAQSTARHQKIKVNETSKIKQNLWAKDIWKTNRESVSRSDWWTVNIFGGKAFVELVSFSLHGMEEWRSAIDGESGDDRMTNWRVWNGMKANENDLQETGETESRSWFQR